jgi:hypothetical protein
MEKEVTFEPGLGDKAKEIMRAKEVLFYFYSHFSALVLYFPAYIFQLILLCTSFGFYSSPLTPLFLFVSFYLFLLFVFFCWFSSVGFLLLVFFCSFSSVRFLLFVFFCSFSSVLFLLFFFFCSFPPIRLPSLLASPPSLHLFSTRIKLPLLINALDQSITCMGSILT